MLDRTRGHEDRSSLKLRPGRHGDAGNKAWEGVGTGAWGKRRGATELQGLSLRATPWAMQSQPAGARAGF